MRLVCGITCLCMQAAAVVPLRSSPCSQRSGRHASTAAPAATALLQSMTVNQPIVQASCWLRPLLQRVLMVAQPQHCLIFFVLHCAPAGAQGHAQDSHQGAGRTAAVLPELAGKQQLAGQQQQQRGAGCCSAVLQADEAAHAALLQSRFTAAGEWLFGCCCCCCCCTSSRGVLAWYAVRSARA